MWAFKVERYTFLHSIWGFVGLLRDPLYLGDAKKVRRDLGVDFCAGVELSSLARTVDAASLGAPGPNTQNNLISLARLTERYVMHKLKKSKKVQMGNWEGELTNDMIECECVF